MMYSELHLTLQDLTVLKDCINITTFFKYFISWLKSVSFYFKCYEAAVKLHVSGAEPKLDIAHFTEKKKCVHGEPFRGISESL